MGRKSGSNEKRRPVTGTYFRVFIYKVRWRSRLLLPKNRSVAKSGAFLTAKVWVGPVKPVQ